MEATLDRVRGLMELLVRQQSYLDSEAFNDEVSPKVLANLRMAHRQMEQWGIDVSNLEGDLREFGIICKMADQKSLFQDYRAKQEAYKAKYADESVRRARVDPKNAASPLSKIVANERAIEEVRWILFDSFDHCNMNIGWVGPASAGKTTLSRIFAEVLEVPFVELLPKVHVTVNDVGEEIERVLRQESIIFDGANDKVYTVLPTTEDGAIILPPMVILMDESHAFPRAVVEALKKATERNDLRLVTKEDTFDCRNVCWHFATDRVADMDDAFISRFEKIELRLYTKDEIAEIVHRKHPEFSEEVCGLIAHYCSRLPREADDFGKLVKKAHRLEPDAWENVVEKVARTKHIDKFGMTERRLNILRALGQKPRSIDELILIAKVKDEKELKKFVLPWLTEETPDQPAYVITANRHYITRAGLAELDKREIPHKGEAVLSPAEREENE